MADAHGGERTGIITHAFDLLEGREPGGRAREGEA